MMAEGLGKRPRDPDEEYGGRPAKNYRVEEFLDSMDPSVRIKLRSMFDDGLLMMSDLDERNISELSKFDASTALEILEHYSSGDLSKVRNRRAYLAGAIKRKLGTPSTPHPASFSAAGAVLAPAVQRKLDEIRQISAKAGDLDQRSLDALATLPPSRALVALSKYGDKDFDTVRNPSALFMTMVRQVMETGAGGDWGPSGGQYRVGQEYDDYGGDYGGGGALAPPPPPPRRAQQATGPPSGPLAGFPVGTTITQGPNGSLVLTSAPVISSLPGLQPVAGAPAAAAGGGGLLLAQAPGAAGTQQFMLVSSSSAPGVAASILPAQATAGGALLATAAQPSLLSAAPVAAAAAVLPGAPPDWALGRKHHGAEQGQLGVRIAEFHDLSPFAVYVHPSPALKLQQLWDDGNELVSMLDDKVWQVLAEMPAPEALAAIQEAADALDNPDMQIRNINAYFLSVVRRVWPQAGGSRGASWADSSHGAARGGYGRGRGRGRVSSGGRGSDWGGELGGYEASGGSKPHFSREPAIHLLPAEQRELAQELCRAHAPLLREEHFDEGVVDSLRRLSHDEGMAVLNELGSNSMAGVRNVPAYIMGISKRYGTGQRSNPGW